MTFEKMPMRELPSFLEHGDVRAALFSMTGCAPCVHLKAALQQTMLPGVGGVAECEYDGRDTMGRSAMLRRGVKSYPTLILYARAREVGRFGPISVERPINVIARDIEAWVREALFLLEDDVVGS